MQNRKERGSRRKSSPEAHRRNNIMGRLYRRSRYLFGILVVLLCVYFYLNYNDRIANERFREHFLNFLGNSSSNPHCDLPLHYSPRDKSITQFMKDLPKSIQCPADGSKNIEPEITIIDEDNNLIRQTDPSASCVYQTIERRPGSDDVFFLSEQYPLDKQNGLELDRLENYVIVKCKQTNGKLYRNIHSWFNPPALQSRANKSTSSTQEKPSILVLVVESLSRLNYLRYMPLTKQYFENEIGNVHYLEGLNKIGDNSYPNMMTFLSGQRAYTGEVARDEVGPFDDNPMIWREFSKAGYWTAFIEDMPRFTLFNYISKGFINQPTTFYPRPSWLYLEQDTTAIIDRLFPFTRDLCFEDRFPMMNILFDQTYSFVKQSSQSGRPFFGFSFAIQVTHNDFNRAQTFDKHLSDFLIRLKPYLDNTIVVLMGDHGNRFGDVLLTDVGRVESRMPLFCVSIPEALKQKSPNIEQRLEQNKQRLVTWTDLHSMLLDVANNDFDDRKEVRDPQTTKVFSPWREEVPESRSCKDAQIPDFFCVCDSRTSVPIDTDFVKDAAQTLINVINTSLKSFTDCLPLTLFNVTNAELIFMPSEIETSKRKQTKYEQRLEVTLAALPSEAILQGRLHKSARDSEWQSDLESISRLNAYGSQSACIDDRRARPFCYCRDYTPNST